MNERNNQDSQGRQNQPDEFEQWLTEQLHDRQPYLEDKGFSDQVMAAVPAAPRIRHLRPLIWATLLALGCVIIMLALFPGWTTLFNLVTAFLTLPLLTLLQIGLGLGLSITALGALAIWRET